MTPGLGDPSPPFGFVSNFNTALIESFNKWCEANQSKLTLMPSDAPAQRTTLFQSQETPPSRFSMKLATWRRITSTPGESL